MDKDGSKLGVPLGIRESSGEERGSSLVSPMVGWLERIAIAILCVSCNAFVMYKVLNFGTSCAFIYVLFLCKRGM